jgi:hypothetical protein
VAKWNYGTLCCTSGTAYYHVGWWSIIGYAIAAVTAVAGFALAFRDLS